MFCYFEDGVSYDIIVISKSIQISFHGHPIWLFYYLVDGLGSTSVSSHPAHIFWMVIGMSRVLDLLKYFEHDEAIAHNVANSIH